MSPSGGSITMVETVERQPPSNQPRPSVRARAGHSAASKTEILRERSNPPVGRVRAFRRDCCSSQPDSLSTQRLGVKAGDRDAREKLCRYVNRPALCLKRLEVHSDGQISWSLRKPWRDGTKAFVMTPYEFLARLAAIVPHPREHQLTYQGVLAPASPRSSIQGDYVIPRPLRRVEEANAGGPAESVIPEYGADGAGSGVDSSVKPSSCRCRHRHPAATKERPAVPYGAAGRSRVTGDLSLATRRDQSFAAFIASRTMGASSRKARPPSPSNMVSSRSTQTFFWVSNLPRRRSSARGSSM